MRLSLYNKANHGNPIYHLHEQTNLSHPKSSHPPIKQPDSGSYGDEIRPSPRNIEQELHVLQQTGLATRRRVALGVASFTLKASRIRYGYFRDHPKSYDKKQNRLIYMFILT